MSIKSKTRQADRHLNEAVTHLRTARNLMKAAGCEKTVRRVRLALTNADGAQRNIQRHPIA